MRNPLHVLKYLEEQSCNKEYQYERLYRNLYNPDFFLLAYKNIATSQGSMTAGTDGKTLSGMSLERIDTIINKLKDHSYQPNPARRVYIKKKGGTKMRPLGIPSTDDKLVQEVVRMLLEAIYEPTFSKHSHGFRPKRSCHTALIDVQTCFKGAKWIVEGDIKACFDSFDHHVLINLLRKRIKDEYFISLMWKFLKAGYMEQWQHMNTYSGTPQGSGMSPILANIYLSELDEYMEDLKHDFNKGDCKHRVKNKEYTRTSATYHRRLKAYRNRDRNADPKIQKAMLREIKDLQKSLFNMSSTEPIEPTYKTLQYNRYADDFIIGVIGSKEDAFEIKSLVKNFLSENLKLTLSDEKTKVTHSSNII